MREQTVDDLLTDALRTLLQDVCTGGVVRAIEAGGPATALWSRIDGSGFADAMVDEQRGGAGLSLADAFPLLELCGAHALPVPLGETMLARAVLAASGSEPARGSIALAQGRATPDGGLHCALVPGGRVADSVLVAHGGDALLLPSSAAETSAAVFALDASLTWPAAAVGTAPRVPAAPDLFTLQACISAAQLAGALMAVFTRTLQYANERIQFGRPIGKFQAIQHQLAVISEHVFAARMAARIGCSAPAHVPDPLRVAVAKARASEAALEVAALSHSIHGAIGFTDELDLQLYTRRLHAWRQTAGSESYWHGVLGDALMSRDRLTLDTIRAITDLD
jgi:acyl-CoA dehydrogenase